MVFPPGRLAKASDPMRRCFEVGSCSGCKITRLLPALRKIRQKFAPPDTAPTTRDDVSKQGYFSLRKGFAREIRTISNASNRLLEEDEWAQEQCDKNPQKPEIEKRIQKPFRTRSEYVGLVLPPRTFSKIRGPNAPKRQEIERGRYIEAIGRDE